MARLEEMDVWNVARETAGSAYRLTLLDGLKHHFALIDQIRRSAISIPSNIAEGYGLATRPQFTKAARIALGSAYELQTQLHIIRDLELVTSGDLDKVHALCGRTIALLIALLKSLGVRLGLG